MLQWSSLKGEGGGGNEEEGLMGRVEMCKGG